MNKNDKPKLELEWNNLDYVLEALAFTGAVTALLTAISYYRELPDAIPVHFNLAGKPDGWGSKDLLWVLPVLGICIYALLTWLNQRPHRFNYLVKITEENAKWHYTQATRVLRYLKAFLCLSFALITWFSIQTAIGKANGLPWWLLVAILMGSIVPAAWLLFTLKK